MNNINLTDAFALLRAGHHLVIGTVNWEITLEARDTSSMGFATAFAFSFCTFLVEKQIMHAQ